MVEHRYHGLWCSLRRIQWFIEFETVLCYFKQGVSTDSPYCVNRDGVSLQYILYIGRHRISVLQSEEC